MYVALLSASVAQEANSHPRAAVKGGDIGTETIDLYLNHLFGFIDALLDTQCDITHAIIRKSGGPIQGHVVPRDHMGYCELPPKQKWRDRWKVRMGRLVINGG